MSLFISKEARKAWRLALRAEGVVSSVPKRRITLDEYRERSKAARKRARVDRKVKEMV